MSNLQDRCRELRASESPRYNCCQAVVVPYAELAGISVEEARRFASNFGGGMRRASTCGAISGGLMAMGLLGLDRPEDTTAFYAAIRARYNNMTECADLLKAAREAGIEKKVHCDGMCIDAVGIVEEILNNRRASEG